MSLEEKVEEMTEQMRAGTYEWGVKSNTRYDPDEEDPLIVVAYDAAVSAAMRWQVPATERMPEPETILKAHEHDPAAECIRIRTEMDAGHVMKDFEIMNGVVVHIYHDPSTRDTVYQAVLPGQLQQQAISVTVPFRHEKLSLRSCQDILNTPQSGLLQKDVHRSAEIHTGM